MTIRHPVTNGLIIAILIVFAAELMHGIPIAGVTNADVPALYEMGAIEGSMFDRGEYWRLLAAMFLHIGILHLLLNLWALYQLGGLFETMFGSLRFASTYFAAGLVASFVSALFRPPGAIAAGASGAIFGILGALIIAIRTSPKWRHQPWTRGLTQQLVAWAALNIVIGFSAPGIDNAAHIGGFIAGLILGSLPHRVPPPPPNQQVIDVGERSMDR